MSQINVSNLTFAYEGSYDNVFENVGFQLDTNWKLGFTGRNGRGKTTFLNLLLGKYEYSGSISASVDFTYFPYEVKDRGAMALDVLDEVCHNLEEWKLNRELKMLDVDESILYRAFSDLSNGEQTKLLLAAMFLNQNSFFLIDEPTNHLDLEGRELLSRYLRSKSGFILVSHDRVFLDGCVDHILSINKANITVTNGNFSTWLANKARQDMFEQGENDKLMDQISHLNRAAARTKVWSDKVESEKIGNGPCDRGAIGAKSAKMMKRSKAIEKRRENAIEEKSRLLNNIERTEELKIHALNYYAKRYVELKNVVVMYECRAVCRPVTFNIEAGDRIALSGRNGSGKSSILKLICGENIQYEGSFLRGSGLKISYVEQDISSLKGSLYDYAQRYGIDDSLFRTILRKLDFTRPQLEKDMVDLSLGQRKKVMIARSMCERAHLYIWDEPMNYIDVISRIQIEDLLLNFKPTICFVEHDREFCNRVATQIISI